MSKQINITYNDKKYTLEYNRKAVRTFEQMGHSLNDIFEKAASTVIPFVMCAFKTNHPAITTAKVEEIYDSIAMSQKADFLRCLVEMYTDTYTSLLGDENAKDEETEGNATWGANWGNE